VSEKIIKISKSEIELPHFIILLFRLKRTVSARTALTVCWAACNLCMKHLLVFKKANIILSQIFYMKFHWYNFVVFRN